MAEYPDPRPSSQPEGSTAMVVAKDNLITLDKMAVSSDPTVTNRKGQVLTTFIGASDKIDADVLLVDSAKDQAIIDINADVATVDNAKDQALIDIAEDVAEVNAAAVVAVSDFEALGQDAIDDFNANGDTALGALGGVHIGEYSTDPLITERNQYVTFGVSPTATQWKITGSTSLNYQIDSTTYPDPENDPSLIMFNDVTREWVNQNFQPVAGTVAAMKAENPTVSQTFKTLGYNSQNDGGSAEYIATSNPLTHDGINHEAANGLVWELVTDTGEVRMNQCGILYDSSTVQQIKFISDYANEKGVNVELTNTASTQVYFDDEFALVNTRLASSLASYLYYNKPVSGGVPDDVAVLRFGSELADARPAYFETTEQFRIGEALRFEPLQGYGEVSFQSDGKCYFKWSRPSGEGEVAPATGTVTGATSGAVQAYTPSTIDSSAVFGSDRNAGWDSVYLRVNTDDVATSHIQSVGVQVSGVRTGRRFGDGGNMIVEGFQTAGYWISNYFLRVNGTLEASKCADGHIFTDNNNEALIGKYIGTCGTEYDAVDRYRGLVGFSNGFHISNLDLEFERGVAQFCFSGCKAFLVDSVYTERGTNYPLMLIRGGAFLDGVATATQDNELFRYAWSTGGKLGGYYALDTYCMKLGSCIDGLEVGQITLLRDPAGSIPANWTSVLDVAGALNIKGIKLNGINSNTWDPETKFSIDMSFPQSQVKFHSSNYEERELSVTQIKPAVDTKMYSRMPVPSSYKYYVTSAAISVRGEASINTRVRVTNDQGGQLATFDLDNGAGDYAYGAGDEDDTYTALAYIDVEAWDLPAVETNVTFSATIKKLRIN